MAERGKGTHLIIFTHADAGAKGTDFNRKEGKDSGESFMKTVWMDEKRRRNSHGKGFFYCHLSLFKSNCYLSVG